MPLQEKKERKKRTITSLIKYKQKTQAKEKRNVVTQWVADMLCTFPGRKNQRAA